MLTVRNKKELEAAIKAGETELFVDGRIMRLACKSAAKLQHSRIVTKNAVANSISETAALAIIVIAAITGLAIIGMLKKYNVEIDYLKGKIKLKYNARNNSN